MILGNFILIKKCQEGSLVFVEGADGTHKIALSHWNKPQWWKLEATKQSVDWSSRVNKRTLGALKALSGNNDRRMRLIDWQINGVKIFHMMNMPDQSHFSGLRNGLKDRGIQWSRMRSKKIHGWNWFHTPELRGHSSNHGLRKVVWDSLIDGPYNNGGRSANIVHFAI